MPTVPRYVIVLVLMLGLVVIDLPAAAAAAPPGRPEPTGRRGVRRSERVPDRYIVVYRPSISDTQGKTDRLERARGFRADRRYSRALRGFSATLSEAQVTALASDPDVEFVTPTARCAPRPSFP